MPLSGSALREGGDQTNSSEGSRGSCVCFCPPDQGFGKCFDRATKATSMPTDGSCPDDVLSSLPLARDFCPTVVQNLQCMPHEVGSEMCGADGGQGDQASTEYQTKCAMVPGMKQLATANCPIAITAWDSCWWQASPCAFSPYFPP